MSVEDNLVLTERKGAVAIVTMNRPQAMNALSRALRAELARTIRTLDIDLDYTDYRARRCWRAGVFGSARS